MIIVVSGPGGVGKGTVVSRLVEHDPTLWLNRSWTTRPRRVGEAETAYTFVDHDAFRAKVAEGGFLEWAEFLGNLYGSPYPEVDGDADVVLEIDVQGARQVIDRVPDALLILLEAPSRQEQEARLRGRGDPEFQVLERLAKADEETAAGRELGAHRVVNGDLDQAVADVAELIAQARERRS